MRLRDIGDVWQLVEQATAQPPSLKNPVRWLPWTAAGLFAAVSVSLAFIHFREEPMRQEPVRYEIFPPGQSPVGVFKVSPDGSMIVYATLNAAGVPQLLIRFKDSLQPKVLVEGEAADVPFWSSDNRYVGYVGGGKLKKIEVSGGSPQTVADVSGAVRGGSWSSNGTTLLGSPGGLLQVPPSGGTPISLTRLDVQRQEVFHGYPQFLPDGRRFIYLRRSTVLENSGVYMGSLDSTDAVPLQRLAATGSGQPFQVATCCFFGKTL